MARFGEVTRVVSGASRSGMRMTVLGLVTVAVAGGAGWYVTRGEDAPAATFETAQVARGTLATTVTLPGTASSTSSVALTFPVAGKIAEVNVVIGQTVRAGDPLARVDDTDARQVLQTAQTNLDLANLKLAQLRAPMKVEDALASRQSVLVARANVQSAQASLTKMTSPPAPLDAAAGDIAVLQAAQSLDQANRAAESSQASLRVAQSTYCSFLTSSVLPGAACLGDSLPLSQKLVQDITITISFQTLLPPGAASAATGLISANSSYLTSRQAAVIAQTSLENAQAKRKQLDQPYTALELQAAHNGVETATASYNVAVAKAAALERGADPLDLQSQVLAVRSQEIAVATAQQKVTDTVLRAPFTGTVGVVPLIVGQQVGTSTAAVTLTDTGTIRVQMTLSESDLTQVRAGQLGVATFDALAGQTFVVRVLGVSPVPTVTQGVVTFAAQASILRPAELVGLQAELQKLAAALASGAARIGAVQILGLTGQGGQGAAPSGTPEASATASGSSTAAATAAAKGGGLGQRPQGAGAAGAQGQGAGGQRPQGAGAASGTSGGQRLPSEGMSGSVILVQSVTENVLLVPSGAVRRENRQSVVLVPDGNGGTESKTVVTGGTDGSRTVILSGLNEGDTVVTSGVRATATATAGGTKTNQALPTGPGGPGGGNVIR